VTTSSNGIRFSIVVATFNAANVLERCIQSIIGQTHRNWELVIVDGGSRDRTVEIIQSHAEHIGYWRSESDDGIYDAWNHALAHVTGDYVCFLGADDALHSPDSLATLAASIGEVHFKLVTSRGQLLDADGNPGRVIGVSWSNAMLPRRIRVCHPGLLHHRSLFDEFGYFNAHYKIAADLDFLLRLPNDISNVDLPIVTVDIQDDGVSRTQFWKRIGEYRMIHSSSPRVGALRAWMYWLDKAWRRPIARLLSLPH
jgi:glycosyltransferase involved in cell wall biosynthesis